MFSMFSIITKIKNWWSQTSHLSNSNDSNSELLYRTCIHEAGHYIMAYMFQHNFQLEYITFDKNAMDISWNGGFKFKGKKVNDLSYYDQLALILISGICTCTILKHGPKMVSSKKAMLPRQADKYLDSQGADVDYAQFKQQIDILSSKFKLDHAKTQWNLFLFAFDFFLRPIVWTAVQDLANLFLNSKEQTHSHDKIHDFLNEKSYFSDLIIIGSDIQEMRYPLTKEKLILKLE